MSIDIPACTFNRRVLRAFLTKSRAVTKITKPDTLTRGIISCSLCLELVRDVAAAAAGGVGCTSGERIVGSGGAWVLVVSCTDTV